jgi:hypothetical protein
MFPHCNIHKHTWTIPYGKTHNQIDHILVERRRHSIALDVRPFRAADCNTDHHLVVANVRGRLTVNYQRSHRFHMEKFKIKKLNEEEGKEQYCVEVSNRFAALENLDTEMEFISAWSAKESVGYFELKKHKPWFSEGW